MPAKNQRFHIFFHWSAVPTTNSHIEIHFPGACVFVMEFLLLEGYNDFFLCVDCLIKIYYICTMLYRGVNPNSRVSCIDFFPSYGTISWYSNIFNLLQRPKTHQWPFVNLCGKLLGSRTFAISAHYPQDDGQTECMNCTIGKILWVHLLDKNQKHCPKNVAVIEMAINYIINAGI